MTNQNTDNNVIVDLNNYTMDRTTLTSRNELIHLEQLDDVCRIIEEKIKVAKEYNPIAPYGFISQNDIISVFARRGAGKTTFVKSMVHLIRTSPEDRFKELRKDLCCVDVLEPNQMMNKERLFIRFLSQISEKFYENEEERCCDQVCKEKYAQLKDVKRKLYEALPVVDGVGKGNLFPDWDDNAYIADRYMNLASNVKDLEKRIHDYIYTGLNVIGKKAILFVLDDSDVNIEKGFEILEIIRLFLTSPQIIVVLTGDASLYSMIVRRHFWGYFNKELLEKDCSALDKSCTKFREYQKMVYRLEAQYLQKMIKADHRIFLNNVYDKIHLNNLKGDKKSEIFIKLTREGDSKEEKFEIVKLYHNILEELDVNKKLISIHNVFINHFLAQPFRNQLRLFTVYDNFRKLPQKNSEILTKGLLKVFEVYINQLSGDSKYLMAHTPIYPAWLLKFLVENNALIIGSSFLPVMDSDSLKNAISVLGMSCYEQIKHNSSIIFDFWIRVSMTKQLSVLLGEEILNDTNTNLISHAQLYSDNGLDKILGNMLTFCKNRTANDESAQKDIPGCIVRKGTKCSSDLGKNYSIEVKLINLLQIESVSHKREISYTYSLYRPLAVLGELLRAISEGGEYDTFGSLFEQLSQVKLYVEPNVNIVASGLMKSEKTNINQYIGKEDRNKLFINNLYDWCKRKEELHVAPFFIDRIFSRYFDLMINYSNNMNEEENTLGDYINNAVLAFWNAAIVEKLLLTEQKDKIDQDNSGDTLLTIFFRNYIEFHKLKSTGGNRSLFVEWLLSCPLLKAYIDPFILELMNTIKEDIFDYTTIWGILRMHLHLQKHDFYNQKLGEISLKMDNISKEIAKYENSIKIYNTIRSKENSIKIYESMLASELFTLQQKRRYQKEIEVLKESREELRKELIKGGIFISHHTPEDIIENLHKELNELDEERLLLEIAASSSCNTSYKQEYNIVNATAKKNISVYPVLSHL